MQVNVDELRKMLGDQPIARRTSLEPDRVHEHAVSVLGSLRGLSKGDKRRVLKRAEKLLDA